MSKNKTYEKGCEPYIPHLHTPAILAQTSPDNREYVLHQIEEIIERFVADDLATIFIDENGNFHYELTKKGIAWNKQQK